MRNKNTITTILAIIGVLAAVAAVLFIFRDKLCSLFDSLKTQGCDIYYEETGEDDIPIAPEAPDAEAIEEEFKDYADVPSNEPEQAS